MTTVGIFSTYAVIIYLIIHFFKGARYSHTATLTSVGGFIIMISIFLVTVVITLDKFHLAFVITLK